MNLRRMNTAVRLNAVIKEKSQDSKLIMVNLPTPPRSLHNQEHCILSSLTLIYFFKPYNSYQILTIRLPISLPLIDIELRNTEKNLRDSRTK